MIVSVGVMVSNVLTLVTARTVQMKMTMVLTKTMKAIQKVTWIVILTLTIIRMMNIKNFYGNVVNVF